MLALSDSSQNLFGSGKLAAGYVAARRFRLHFLRKGA